MKRGVALLLAATGMLAFALASHGSAPAGATSPPIRALVQVDGAAIAAGLPKTLSEYGFFQDGPAQYPADRVYPYRLNTPLYSDGADKLRFFYRPIGQSIETDGEGLLKFPVGSALIKTFAFGEGADRRLIETRVLLHRAEGWVALPYKWNEEQTEATLALVGGRLDLTTPAGDQISYRIPNKNQCKQCHSVDDTVVPIGPKARNLSAAFLRQHVGLAPDGSDTMPRWEDRADAPLDKVARAYLDVNCAHCHRPEGKASNSGLDLRWEQHDPVALGVGKRPVAAGRGSGGLNFSIVPGDPERSIMVHRMASDNPGVAMPELGKSTIDKEGLAVVERWIGDMGE